MNIFTRYIDWAIAVGESTTNAFDAVICFVFLGMLPVAALSISGAALLIFLVNNQPFILLACTVGLVLFAMYRLYEVIRRRKKKEENTVYTGQCSYHD